MEDKKLDENELKKISGGANRGIDFEKAECYEKKYFYIDKEEVSYVFNVGDRALLKGSSKIYTGKIVNKGSSYHWYNYSVKLDWYDFYCDETRTTYRTLTRDCFIKKPF